MRPAYISPIKTWGLFDRALDHEITWNVNLMQQGNFINVFLARHVSGTYAHHQEHWMLRCSIWFSAPSFWTGGGLESRCVGRVYGADGARRCWKLRSPNILSHQLIDIHRCFEIANCLHLQDKLSFLKLLEHEDGIVRRNIGNYLQSTWRNISEYLTLRF